MASSIRDQIIAAMVTALGASGAPTGLTVDRQRLRALVQSQLPSVVVYPVMETVEIQTHDEPGVYLRTLTVGLECRASGDPVDASLDPIMNWNSSVFYANRKWGGLALYTTETRVSWEGATGETDFGRALQEFEVRYLTSEDDQTVA